MIVVVGAVLVTAGGPGGGHGPIGGADVVEAGGDVVEVTGFAAEVDDDVAHAVVVAPAQVERSVPAERSGGSVTDDGAVAGTTVADPFPDVARCPAVLDAVPAGSSPSAPGAARPPSPPPVPPPAGAHAVEVGQGACREEVVVGTDGWRVTGVPRRWTEADCTECPRPGESDG
ncbi:MAG TPA: hypothetical protein VI248_21295 [Kineosporiaceae bacterium]